MVVIEYFITAVSVLHRMNFLMSFFFKSCVNNCGEPFIFISYVQVEEKILKIIFLSSEYSTKKTSEKFCMGVFLTVPEDISGTPYIYGDRAG